MYRDRVAHPPEGDVIGRYRDALREAAGRAGVPYLEVPELTEASYPENAALFEEHIHPNHRGARLLASRVVEALHADGLLAPASPAALSAPP